MKIFGIALIVATLLLAGLISIPAFSNGQILIALVIIFSAIMVSAWVFAIYGPLSAKYDETKKSFSSALRRPFACLLIIGLSIFFSYRAISSIFVKSCEIDRSTGKGALAREYFNFFCSHYGYLGYAISNLVFAALFFLIFVVLARYYIRSEA